MGWSQGGESSQFSVVLPQEVPLCVLRTKLDVVEFSGGGQTGRTTAHLMAWYDDFYYVVEKVHGKDIAQLVADSYRKCIDWVEKVVEEEGIECDFARVDGYLFPHEDSKEAVDTLQKVSHAINLSILYLYPLSCRGSMRR